MKKRIASLIVILLAFLISLCGCAGEVDGTPPSVSINGTPLEEFKVVYDGNDIYSQFAAENLQLYLEQKFAVEIPVLSDEAQEAQYEILIGETNRLLSVDGEDALSAEQYAYQAKSDKIVLKAKGYMVGGAARGLLDAIEGTKKTKNTLNTVISEKAVVKEYTYKKAKNALLYIGDGMGFNHIEWAKAEGMPKFYAADMPNRGEALTYSHSVALGQASATDSAAAATALATGYKTKNGRIGYSWGNDSVMNIRELAHSKGAKTAVLTTDDIKGATPSAFLVHVLNRDMTEKIALKQKELKDAGGVDIAEGSLSEALLSRSKNALKTISADNSSFFMMLEEGHIDSGSHNNEKDTMFKALGRFNSTIAYAMQFALVRGDTVLIVTADHETGGITLAGEYSFTSDGHTGVNVPLFAMGEGTEALTEKPLNNVLIPRFMARIYGEENFGDSTVTE